MTSAIFGGSFDPFTNAHLNIVQKAAKLFNPVIVVVATNPIKHYMFSAEERCALIAQIAIDAGLGEQVQCAILDQEIYLANYAAANSCHHLVRGISGPEDLAFEKNMYNTNRQINSDVETVFLMADKPHTNIRSSFVKHLATCHGWVDIVKSMVPKPVLDALLLRHMETRWKKFAAKQLGISLAVIESTWDKLKAAYANRPYHNFYHILRMLDAMDKYPRVCSMSAYMTLAIWFHDFIVASDDTKCASPGAAEAASTVLAHELAPIGGGSSVANLIMCTAHGFVIPQGYFEQVIAGEDLAILATDRDTYIQYSRDVEREYSRLYTLAGFNASRIHFLRRLLDIKRIFPDLPQFEGFDNRARENIRWELEWRTVA